MIATPHEAATEATTRRLEEIAEQVRSVGVQLALHDYAA
jgi:hypothetical protein